MNGLSDTLPLIFPPFRCTELFQKSNISPIEVEGKTIGDVYLNDQENPEYYDSITQDTTNKCLDGFNKNSLSNSESYLVIYENKENNYTWNMWIDSKEVLKEFLRFFGKVLMNIQPDETSDNDDIPF
ncbi:hypothetical protein [Cylindrospermum sp. FACHB-282]|uniref:hypothetical protein n=1 Tax=Cylindrospermum sp. FACHB-282 TaxID=2692794 RepID=UPI001682C951|nr:hypothetical protein [Cylindrospermum sp. FACHB-282]MBD2388612.1 hypothetical protein [Cylindrospermum sp. FACHB-282]